MTEISTVQMLPQMTIKKDVTVYKGGKSYLLNEPINDAVTISTAKEKTGGAGKGFASAILPGLGQMIDGRFWSGLGFLGGMIGLNALNNKLNKGFHRGLVKEWIRNKANLEKAVDAKNYKEVAKQMFNGVKTAFNKLPKSGKFAAIALPLISWGAYIANIRDAAKGKN